MFLLWVLALAAALALALYLYLRFSPRMGADPEGARLERILASPNQQDGLFRNLQPTSMDLPASKMLTLMWEMLRGGNGREPVDTIPTVPFDRAAWDMLPDTGWALAWFGHSSLLLRMDGKTFLLDPVFGERASTFSFVGPKRFNYTGHMSVDQLPHIDVVLLSHDHYDHLDQGTIEQLLAIPAARNARYMAPLGVGAHLEHWGVGPGAIAEYDWWEGAGLDGVRLTLVPSRHFSGRALNNRFSTLWGGWVIEGHGQKVYFGADSGFSPTFREIGERFGPFDLALLECGAYNTDWAQIHMMPEETAQAAVDVRARRLMPVHWGKFNLALHPWKEPIERLSVAAGQHQLPLLTPRIGRIVTMDGPDPSEAWWKELR